MSLVFTGGTPRAFVFWGHLYTGTLVFLLGHAHPHTHTYTHNHTHTLTHFWLVPALWLPGCCLPWFQGRLITLINILLADTGSSTNQSSPWGRLLQNIPPLSSPHHHPISTKHVFLSTSDMHLLVQPPVFLLCRFMRRMQGKPGPSAGPRGRTCFWEAPHLTLLLRSVTAHPFPIQPRAWWMLAHTGTNVNPFYCVRAPWLQRGGVLFFHQCFLYFTDHYNFKKIKTKEFKSNTDCLNSCARTVKLLFQSPSWTVVLISRGSENLPHWSF